MLWACFLVFSVIASLQADCDQVFLEINLFLVLRLAGLLVLRVESSTDWWSLTGCERMLPSSLATSACKRGNSS